MSEVRQWSPYSAWDEACSSWDELYRAVIYFKTHRLVKLLESERSGKGITAADALEDAAALAAYSRRFYESVHQMAREEV